MKEKVEFKGSVVLNPVPVVLITSKNKEEKKMFLLLGGLEQFVQNRLCYQYLLGQKGYLMNI